MPTTLFTLHVRSVSNSNLKSSGSIVILRIALSLNPVSKANDVAGKATSKIPAINKTQINDVLGCSHGCKYPCYAYLMAKRFGKVASYEEWCTPVLVSNTLPLLDKEIPKLKSKIQSVQLCFTTDPFMYGYDEIIQMSLAAIKKLNAAGIKCTALTKGILPTELSSFSQENEYGITFVSMNEDYRERMEPGAAPYADRLEALRALHDAGCKTWVSIEPYPTPNLIEQNISDILSAVSFTDRIIFGRTNYSKEISAYKRHKNFYNKEADKVIDFCTKRGIAYHIKNGTIAATEGTK